MKSGLRQKLGALVLFCGLIGATGASAKTYELKLGTVAPDGTPWSEQLNNFRDRVHKESDGRIKVVNFLGGVVGGEDEMIRKVLRGRSLNSGGFSTNALSSVVPALQLISLPFLFDSLEEADYVLDTFLTKHLEKELEKEGLVFMFWADNGMKSFINSERPINTPEDVAGLRMRSQPNKAHIAFYKALDASPVPMGMPEVLPALQRGVIDGSDQTPLLIVAASWNTAIKYYSLTRHLYEPAMVVVNKKWFDRLPEDLQTIVLGDQIAQAEDGRKRVRKIMPELIEVIRASGVQVNEISPENRAKFRQATRHLHQEVAKEIGATDLLERIYEGQRKYQETQTQTNAPE